MVPLPYTKGLSEELRRTFKALGVGTYFKPRNTLRQLLVAPKDPSKKEKCGVVYLIKCDGEKEREECKSSYIGEMASTLKASTVKTLAA